MSRTYTNLKFHALVCVQDNSPLIPANLRDRLQKYITGILKRRRARLLRIGGTEDHLHVLMGLRTTHSPDRILTDIKEATAFWLSQAIGPAFAWEPGYDVYSVSESKARDVMNFIEEQEERHRSMALWEEQQRLRTLHGIKPLKESSANSRLRYHFVFSTRERLWLIDPHLQEDLYAHIDNIIRGEGGYLLEIGGIPDHVHLLVDMKPGHTLARMLQMIKGGSSRWATGGEDRESWFGWQGGYGGFTVSESQIAKARAYIQNQEDHHRTVSFDEEFKRMIEAHNLVEEEHEVEKTE